MGIAFFTFNGLCRPLRNLMGWLGHRTGTAEAIPAARQPMKHASVARARAVRPAAPARLCEKARRPLRVVRLVEGSGPPASAGRMFMSGRMADVCAELDRLAALEAAAG
ncbi:MAG: hypothetical protein Q8R01_05215 [Ramlibacter sp.]|nr:hypothetical protein [Ramlibacter sp.]